jgi:hypothetical protein
MERALSSQSSQSSQSHVRISQHVEVEVLDYSIEGDRLIAENHICTLEVKLSAKSGNNYTLRRTLIAFSDLDSKLRRKFPKSNIPPLPLSNASARRKSVKQGDPAAGSDPPTVSNLTEYLRSLLSTPEVLKSPELWNFFDFEYPDGVPSPSAAATVADVVLTNVEPSTKTVSKEFELALEAKASEYVAWSFSTKSKDIGFRIVFNNVDIVAYQRYNSHEVQVKGVVEIPEDGVVILMWDNSYSKLRSKVLTYSGAVISAEGLKQATSVTATAIRQSVMYNKCRSSLKRCVLLQASDLNQSRSDTIYQGLSVEEIRFLKLEQQLDDLTDEKTILELDLSESNALLNEQTAEMQGMKDTIKGLRVERDAFHQEASKRIQAHEESLNLVKDVETTATGLTQELAERKAELERMSAKLQSSEKRMEALQSSIIDMNIENSALLKRAEHGERECLVLADRVGSLEASTQVLEDRLISCEEDRARAVSACEEMHRLFTGTVKNALMAAQLECETRRGMEDGLKQELRMARDDVRTATELHSTLVTQLQDVISSVELFRKTAANGHSCSSGGSGGGGVSCQSDSSNKHANVVFCSDIDDTLQCMHDSIENIMASLHHNC